MAQARRLRLRFTGKAERQLAAIAKYIEKDSPRAALRVVTEIRAAASSLTDFPEIGRPGAVPTTREWVVTGLPYVIVYRPDSARGELAVIEIFHGAQDRPRGGA